MGKGEKKDSNLSKIFNALQKIGYVLFNLTYVGAFIAYTIFVFYNKNQGITWLPYVLIAITLLYFVAFLFVIFQKDDKNVKQDVKTYKKSLKIFKKVLKLSNLVMTAVMIANTVMYDQSWFAFGLAVANCVITVLQLLSTLFKMLKKEKKRKIKEEKQELKNSLVSDIKGMIEEPEQDNFEVQSSVAVVESKNNKPINNISRAVNRATNLAKNADKINDRVRQYNDDKKQVGKKKKK